MIQVGTIFIQLVIYIFLKFTNYSFFLLGLYGHSAVFDDKTETIYVFGGYLYRSEDWYVSQELFTLDIKVKMWNMLQPEENSKVQHLSI